MKKFPGNKGEKVIADDKCGLHVHFDSKCLTQNPERTPNALVQLAYSNIEKIKSRIIDKGDTEYDK